MDDETGNKTKREFIIDNAENITKMSISFNRRVTKRNTGLRVSWYYSPPQTIRAEERFVEDNKLFILLANLVHQHGVTADMEQNIRDVIREDFQIKIVCLMGLTLTKISFFAISIQGSG